VYERVRRGAESSYQFSIPLPGGRALINTHLSDASDLIALQNERSMLLARAETAYEKARMSEHSKRGRQVKALREEAP